LAIRLGRTDQVRKTVDPTFASGTKSSPGLAADLIMTGGDEHRAQGPLAFWSVSRLNDVAIGRPGGSCRNALAPSLVRAS